MNGIWITTYALLWLVVLLEAVFIIAILRSLGGMHLRLEQLAPHQTAPGTLAPGDRLAGGHFTGLSGEDLDLAALWRKGQLLLFFVSTGCAPCRDTLRQFADLYPASREAGWRACVLCAGQPTMVSYLVEDAGLPASLPVVAVDQEHLIRAYGVATTPTLVTVDAAGRVRDVVVGPSDDGQLRQILFGQAVPALPVS